MIANRRDFLISATGVGGLILTGAGAAFAAPARPDWLHGSMGMASAAMPRAPRAPTPPAAPGAAPAARGGGAAAGAVNAVVAQLQAVRDLGGDGLEVQPNDADLPIIKAKLEELGMFAGLQARLPNTPDGDFSGLEQSCKQAQYLGATSMRAAMGDRRYEAFKTYAEWKVWFDNVNAIVKKAAPICERYKVAMAIENHKDRTGEQQAALLKEVSSEYVGSLVDFGNSISLCETVDETVSLLAPYVKSCHFKDMGVQPYEDGFLLSEVPAGTGLVDLAGVIATLRKVNPQLRLFQETITRDPLKIPIKTDLYWATFPERRAQRQAKMEAWVEQHKSKTPLRILSAMTAQQQYDTAVADAKAGFSWVKSHNA